MEKILLLSQ